MSTISNSHSQDVQSQRVDILVLVRSIMLLTGAHTLTRLGVVPALAGRTVPGSVELVLSVPSGPSKGEITGAGSKLEATALDPTNPGFGACLVKQVILKSCLIFSRFLPQLNYLPLLLLVHLQRLSRLLLLLTTRITTP